MIEQLDIENFGSFKNFIWKDSIRDKGNNVADFKKLNILYGRNYAGKTTFSRIFRAIEVQKLPEKYNDPLFKIKTESGMIDQVSLTAYPQNIRVYNKDFVTENLSVLKGDIDGEIKTFAIIGGENQEIEKQILEKKTILGSIEDKNSLRGKFTQRSSDYSRALEKANQARKNLDNKLRDQANGVIKPNREYGDTNYNIDKIKKDIVTITSGNFVTSEDQKLIDCQDILRATKLDDISHIRKPLLQINELYTKAQELLSKQIAPTQPIQELLNDTLLQTWVREGIPYHRNKRGKCGFCGQSLPKDLWHKLDAHFNKESTELEDRLRKLIQAIEKEKDEVKKICEIKKDRFYNTNQSSFEDKFETLDREIVKYQSQLDLILKYLRSRIENVFESVVLQELQENTFDITKSIDAINSVITQNNQQTISLKEDQDIARETLRLNIVSKFIRTIDLLNEESKIEELFDVATTLNNDKNKLQENIKVLEHDLESLAAKQNDEAKGAEKVNEYLTHFFGHRSLKLEPIKDSNGKCFKFEILRGDETAYNLSEGECSLVAFCYFMAKLEDSNTHGKNLIIFIDDPISSLDSNHIFFVYSLIANVIVQTAKNAQGKSAFGYEQLFISTHNLDFLKYLKRLCSKGDNQHFILEMTNCGSSLSLMPDYLKNYITEFNYLFHQIYKCSQAQNATDDHQCFYNFGNNLRKFLEAYLFYKYPCHENPQDRDEKLRKFFDGDAQATHVATRLNNELSHLELIFDRSMHPIDIPEIPKLATFVLGKIQEKDPDQYDALLQSIGVDSNNV